MSVFSGRIAARTAIVCSVLAASASAQGSVAALRFHGTGADQDRVRIRVDDDAPGPDASAPCDVGSGSFTLQFWVRGRLSENGGATAGVEGSYADERWWTAPCVLDRSVTAGTGRTFGVALSGGRVSFGTGTGDGPGFDAPNTLEGSVVVLDDAWHHVSVSRDVQSGRKTIFVDGMLDASSAFGVSTADLSYPDDGLSGAGAPDAPYLVVGASKSDVGGLRPSFQGRLDELHVWARTRRGTEVVTDMVRVVPPGSGGLAASYRFEEGAGTIARDTSGNGNPDGDVVAGVPGNAEWTHYATAPDQVAPVTAGSLPAGFSRSTYTSGLDEPTSMAFTPDGRLLVTQRLGQLRVVSNGTLLPTPALSLAVDTTGERGLLSVVVDPDFATNHWVYLYATSVEPRSRLLRYTLNGDVADPASQLVVWQNPATAGSTHMGGGIAFGNDGFLYLATGDQGSGANAQMLDSEHGKILRFARDGSIPADNPFVGVPGARPAIWAYGARNPFRLVVDPLDGALFESEVGGNSTSSAEELNRIQRGANYGWPGQEGLDCFASSCAGVTYPTWTYRHDDPSYAIVTGGGCIVAGAFYRASQFPPEYRGNLFVADYANRWIRRLVFDAAGQVVASTEFDPQPSAGPVVDLDVGPDGALYTLGYGPNVPGNPDSARITRIAWTGANLPPIAVATASNDAGPTPLAIQFTGSASIDPDQAPGALQHAWDFGDGATSTLADPAHVYTVPGQFQAVLTVSDGALATAGAPILVRAGNPPRVRLTVPSAAAPYRAGDVISFSGLAKDVEDGVLAPSALTWQVLLVHLAHTHPFLGPASGIAGGSFQIPLGGHEPADTHFVVHLLARDSDGLESEAEVHLRPRIVPVVFTTKPVGIPLTVDGAPAPTPYAFEGLANFHHVLAAPATRLVGGTLYAFERWRGAGVGAGTSPTLAWTAPDAGGTAIAEYVAAKTTTTAVAAPARNAQHDGASGQAPSESGQRARIAFGLEPSGPIEAGFEFRLPIPRGARILSARIQARAALSSVNVVEARIRVYTVASAPPFAFGSPTPLSAHAPTSNDSVPWTAGPWTGGAAVATPDLAGLVQTVVSRPDWTSGGVIGLVVLPSSHFATGSLRVGNFASPEPPSLVVEWAPPQATLGGH